MFHFSPWFLLNSRVNFQPALQVLTNRVFLIDSESPLPLQLLLEPRGIDWRVPRQREDLETSLGASWNPTEKSTNLKNKKSETSWNRLLLVFFLCLNFCWWSQNILQKCQNRTFVSCFDRNCHLTLESPTGTQVAGGIRATASNWGCEKYVGKTS